jgi:hypothetical protein
VSGRISRSRRPRASSSIAAAAGAADAAGELLYGFAEAICDRKQERRRRSSSCWGCAPASRIGASTTPATYFLPDRWSAPRAAPGAPRRPRGRRHARDPREADAGAIEIAIVGAIDPERYRTLSSPTTR